VGRLGDALADQDLAGAACGDPGGEVDGAVEVVAALGHHRAGRHPDMGRRQAGLGQLRHQLQGRAHRPGRLLVVDHHFVAQPLHRHPAVLARRPADQHGQGLGERGGGRIAPLFGAAGVAGQVEE
jgi:hypothetical protein